MKIINFILFSILLTNIATAKDSQKADMNRHLEKFLLKMGYSVNEVKAAIYHDQKAGYATGGSISLRNQVSDIQPINIQMPKFNGGCGGIDIYKGAFSFLSGQEIIDTLKNIGSSAMGYAFMLALETTSPQIANNIKTLQGWANQINSIGINSCEMGTQIVGAMWPSHERASEYICNNIGTNTGKVTDFIKARHDCSNSKTADNITSEKDYLENNQLPKNYNIAWEIIKKYPNPQADPLLPFLMMTLTGTIVFSDQTKNNIIKPPKALEDDFLETFLNGGEISIYKCEDQNSGKCLSVINDLIHLKEEESLLGKVKKMVLDIQDHIMKDLELTPELQSFLNISDLPILRLIATQMAYYHGKCSINHFQWVDIVARDWVVKYLRDMIEFCQNTANSMKLAQMDIKPVQEYINNLNKIEKKILYMENKTKERQEREMLTLQKLDWLEEKIRSNW